MDDKEVTSHKQQQFVMAITEIMKQTSYPKVSMELIRDYKEGG